MAKMVPDGVPHFLLPPRHEGHEGVHMTALRGMYVRCALATIPCMPRVFLAAICSMSQRDDNMANSVAVNK